jgi:RNA polymerase sigma-70 factor (ECF subfamily)
MSGNLSEAFERAVAPALKGRASEDALAKLVAAGVEAWPELSLDAEVFVAHVATVMTADAAVETLHAADLYLAFGCLLGDPAALEALEKNGLVKVPAVLGNLPAGVTTDDVLQKLRLKLFVRAGDAPGAVAGYSGRGPLVQWLRAAALRIVQDFARRGQKEVATDDAALIDTPAAGIDPDVQFLKARYAPDFKAAFQEALQSLGPKELSLLKLQYLDGVSPEEIGRIYQAHRTTVWRWLAQCREDLLSRTKALLAARVKVDAGELSSLMNAVHSQIDVSISRMLRKP